MATAQKVQRDTFPIFFAFYKHYTCKIVIATGATSSLGILERPTLQAARQLDKSKMKVSSKVKFTLNFRDTELPTDGLANDKLDCDILAGVPFCKTSNIELHLKEEEITINGKRIPYGSKPDSIQHDIYLMESCTLHNNVSQVLFPGEFLEIYDNFSIYEGEIAVEPRV